MLKNSDIPESTKRAMWDFFMKTSVPVLLEEKIRQKEASEKTKKKGIPGSEKD